MASALRTELLKRTVGLLGVGKMGQAIVQGLLKQGMPRSQVIAAEPNPETRSTVARQLRIKLYEHNPLVVAAADVLILAVKPQTMHAVLEDISAHLKPHTLVVSIAAGITLRTLQRALPGAPVVRVMPNLPATVGQGFTAIALGGLCRPVHARVVRSLFSAVGETIDLPEHHFDAITAVSGSGPAYVFHFVHCWEAAARALNLSEAAAKLAILHTLRGSLTLLATSQSDARTLAQNVASKGGTTEAALKVFNEYRFDRMLQAALQAAAQRSQELSC
jgi:pyrroline-5-carboxylate reductase